MRVRTILVLAGILSAILLSTELRAVPSFSRIYQTSCVTCHEAFPRRNAVGEAFRLNGFRFEDDEAYRKVRQVDIGDEAYKKLWPKAVWPTTIPAHTPISITTRFLGEIDMDGTRDAGVLFLFPEELELMWAGTLGDKFSVYGDVIFIQKDFGGLEVESWATLKAWLGIEDLLGDNVLNLRLGTLGAQTFGLFTGRDENNFTTHYYLYTSWTMPVPKPKLTDLNDFQGNNFSIGPQIGLEAHGFGARWRYGFGVVNGNLKTAATEAPDSAISFMGASKNRGKKDFFFDTAFKLGGLGFDGSGATVDNPLTARPEYWRDDSLILSLWGYVGSSDIEIEDAAGVRWEGEDDFWRLGLGAQQKIKDLTIGGGYMFGRNDNPYGNLSSKQVDSRAWYAEAMYFALPWLIPYGRYEGLDLDLPQGITGLDPDQDNARVVVGLKSLVRANVALSVEGNFYVKGAELQEGLDRTLFVLLNLSF